MKAIILAAGNGTRLHPLTDNWPKCLAPIQGRPLLQIWLENCERAGIGEVLINVHAQAAQVRDFAATQEGGVRIHIVEERELLGSAGTLAANRTFVAGESAFLVLYGDVLTNVNPAEVAAFHHGKNVLATLGTTRVSDPRRCGIATVDENGIVCRFQEKPSYPSGNWAFSGIMAASPEVLEFIPGERPADIGSHLLPRLVGRMTALPLQGFVLDIGTPENYALAQSSWRGLTEETCCAP